MERNLQFGFLISVFSLILICSASIPSRDSLGIAPQDESFYKASVIKCKDGSKKFSRDQLNDEFCDCPDGTDEPGTSACPEGKFYCRNTGHAPLAIFSSRVNDGICDCCDGSDEYDGNMNCSNTCWEAGKAARKKLEKKIATFQDGVIIRNKEVANAKLSLAKDEAELAKLKSEEKMLKSIVDKLKEQKERIEKAEAEERAKKEAEEKRLKEEADKLAAKDKESVISEETKENLLEPSHQDKSEDQHEDDVQDEKITKEEQESGSTEKLSKEELGRLVASRWTGEQKSSEENDENTPTDDGIITDNPDDDDSVDPEPVKGEEDSEDSYHSEMEDDRHNYKDDSEHFNDDDAYDSDDDLPDNNNNNINNHNNDNIDGIDDNDREKAENSNSLLDKIQQTVQSVFQSFNFFKTPIDLSESSRVKKEYDDLSSKLSKIQSKISNLGDKLKHDFGKDKEFYSFYDQCFENKQNKYVYKVCPYKKASQTEGHSSTQLGRWEKFEDSYRVMVFSNGDHCWNGPNRSLKVRLRCGVDNEVADVDEPSRCEYVAILSTPAVCVEEKLKELKQNLEDLNSSQPDIHDEL